MGTGPLIQAPGASNTTPIVVAPPSQTAQQPNYSDIDDYLKFVRQVERTKQALIHRELASALSQYGNMLPNEVKAATDDDAGKDFLPNINKDPKNFSGEWNQLTQAFLQRQPRSPALACTTNITIIWAKSRACSTKSMMP